MHTPILAAFLLAEVVVVSICGLDRRNYHLVFAGELYPFRDTFAGVGGGEED